MLKRVNRIQGVGLFSNASPSALGLEQLTLIFGENAVGKSTLSAVMRSLATGDANILAERRTFKFVDEQQVEILGENGVTFEFVDGNWSQKHKDIFVFDTAFVEENVYSGTTIRSTQRKSLLDFAIGSEAVAEKQAELAAASVAKQKRDEVREVEAEFSSFRGQMGLKDFLNLQEHESAQPQIESLQEKLVQARRVNTLKSRRRPKQVTKPVLDLGRIEEVLSSSLDSVHEEASQRVRDRIKAMHDHRAETWLATGLQLTQDSQCPFCGQGLDSNQLISDYRSFFDAAYKQLMQDISELPKLVERAVQGISPDTMISDIASQQALLDTWSEDAELADLEVDEEVIRDHCHSIAAGLRDLATKKRDAPTVAIGKASLGSLHETHQVTLAAIEKVNGGIEKANSGIDKSIGQLEALSEADIATKITQIELSEVRHSEEVLEAEIRLSAARKAASDAEKQKDESREKARSHVNSLLDSYADEINHLLATFNASFRVETLEHDYRAGGDPAVRYALSVRNEVLDASQSERLLRAVLSEGDRRTLAFAFFVAALKSHGNLASKVIVLDDPVTSLDSNRKRATIEIIDQFCKDAKQTIILGHDENFLLNTRDWAKNRNPNLKVLEAKISLVGDHAVTLLATSLDEQCRSDYARDYQVVVAYLEGKATKRDASRSLRPLLEGYLRRRFPLHMNGGDLLMSMVQKIESAPESSPLAAAMSETSRLKTLNTYSRDAHHGDRPDQGSGLELSDAEVRSDCSAVLEVIHGWGASAQG